MMKDNDTRLDAELQADPQENPQHRVICGDCRDMTEIEDNSVDLVVTSPPYWQLKDYGTHSGVGFNDSYEEYINHLNLVWKETHRVLDNGCRLCINIGDQYARSVIYGRYKVIPIRTEIIRFCETIGFDYMGAIIWRKIATTNTSGGATIMGSYPHPRNGILKMDYEFILILKKHDQLTKNEKNEKNKKNKIIPREIKEKSKMTKEEWNTFFSGHWNFPGVRQNKHLAMFPIELPRRLIKMFSFHGDTVLDPFLGSGTTSRAAMELGRNSVGYEINPDFIPTIKENLGPQCQLLYQTPETPGKDFSQQINQLPYVFKDPVKLDQKIDPRNARFASKINADDRGDVKTYYRLKEVISPEIIRLNNGVTIKLLGIRQKNDCRDAAIQYLQNKLKGHPLFLKTDDRPNETMKTANMKPDKDGNRPCYLYLKNKTFINAHLLKEQLATVDTSRPFKYKKKFLNLVKKSQEE